MINNWGKFKKITNFSKFLNSSYVDNGSVELVYPLPHKQGQLLGNCGYIVLAMIQLFWIYLGCKKLFFPAQSTDIENFSGDSLMQLRELLHVKNGGGEKNRWGIFKATYFANFAQAIGYKGEVYEGENPSQLQEIINAAISVNIPVVIAFDLDVSGGAQVGSTGEHAHWGLIFGKYHRKGKLHYMMTHGHNGYFWENADHLCKSSLQLQEVRGAKLSLKGRLILVYPEEYVDGVIIKSFRKIEKYRVAQKKTCANITNLLRPSDPADLIGNRPGMFYSRVLSLAAYCSNVNSLTKHIRNISFSALERLFDLKVIKEAEFINLIAEKIITEPYNASCDFYIKKYVRNFMQKYAMDGVSEIKMASKAINKMKEALKLLAGQQPHLAKDCGFDENGQFLVESNSKDQLNFKLYL